jgi:hypothetical protein
VKPSSFDIFSGWCAVLAGVFALLYALSFIVISRLAPDTGALLAAFFFTLVGLLGSVVLTALFGRFRAVAGEFALWAYFLGAVGSIGTAIHGSYDLANAIHPSQLVVAAALADVPSQVDPRGFLAFFVGGLAILAFSWLIVSTARLPRRLGIVGYANATLLILLYLARLIILTPTNPVVVALAVLTGFIFSPLWYFGLGLALWRGVTPLSE